MRTAKQISIIAAISAIAGGIVLLMLALAMMNFDITKLSVVDFKEQAYTIEESFDSIYIEGAECSVRFVPSEGDTCSVECMESDKIYHTVKVKDNKLVIKRVDDRKWYEHIGVYISNTKITVFLPKTQYKELYIKTVSGDIDIPGIYTFDSAEIYSTSGDVSFSGTVADKLYVKTVSGDLSLRDTEALTIEAMSTSGEAEFSSVKARESIKIKTTSGDSFKE